MDERESRDAGSVGPPIVVELFVELLIREFPPVELTEGIEWNPPTVDDMEPLLGVDSRIGILFIWTEEEELDCDCESREWVEELRD